MQIRLGRKDLLSVREFKDELWREINKAALKREKKEVIFVVSPFLRSTAFYIYVCVCSFLFTCKHKNINDHNNSLVCFCKNNTYILVLKVISSLHSILNQSKHEWLSKFFFFFLVLKMVNMNKWNWYVQQHNNRRIGATFQQW